MIVRISPAAEGELESIGGYIARDNSRRAVSFVREFRDQCLSLADMALAFPFVPRYEDRGVRHRVHGNYQIFYPVVDRPPERIDIIYVLHGARDISAIFFP